MALAARQSPADPDVDRAARQLRDVARRYLALHHLLAPPRSLPPGREGILAVFDRLGLDPVRPDRDRRPEPRPRPARARRGLPARGRRTASCTRTRALFETYNKGLSLVPTAELPWYRVNWDRARTAARGRRVRRARAARRASCSPGSATTGPMSSIDVEPRAAIDWYWRPTNQVRALLEALAEAGILGLSRRDGNRRVYDLVERLFPAERPAHPGVPIRDAFRHKLLSRYRAHGLLGTSGQRGALARDRRRRSTIGTEDGLPLDAAGRRELHAELIDRRARSCR